MAFVADCLDTLAVCPNRLKTLCTGQSTVNNELCLEMVDICTGQPIDLTEFGIPGGSSSSSSSPILAPSWISSSSSPEPGKHGVEIVLKELPSSIDYVTKMATVKSEADAKAGRICITTDALLTKKAGIWCAMAIIWSHGDQRRHYPFYFNVTPNLRDFDYSGPLAFYEIRLAVRDTCPEMNFLIDRVDFTDEEIVWAMRRPIDQWNELLPPVAIFTPLNFPFRYHWLEATIGELMVMVATWMRRNDLDYSAAGLSVDDTKKWPFYLQMAKERRERWEVWAKNMKIKLNLDGAYMTVLGYRSAPYR